MLERAIDTGKEDLTRFVRQVADILNWLERGGILVRMTVNGKPAWTLPVIETVEDHEDRLDDLEGDVAVLETSELREVLHRLGRVENALRFLGVEPNEFPAESALPAGDAL